MSTVLIVALMLVTLARLLCGTKSNMADLSPLSLTKLAGHMLTGASVTWWYGTGDEDVLFVLACAAGCELFMWLRNPEWTARN